MTLTQYIAIRSVLDYEMREHPENEVLIKSIALLLDEEENLSKEDYGKLKESIDTIAAAAAGGAEKTALANMFSAVIDNAVMNIVPVTGIVDGSAGCLWLKKVLPTDSELPSAGRQKK